MCGISVLLNEYFFGELVEKHVVERFEKGFEKGTGRGPEDKRILHDTSMGFRAGFHRLAINGWKDDKSMQPLEIDDCILLCNGEIYNWRAIYETLRINPSTKSDCEVIIHLYRHFGMKQTLQLLDGVFAFVLFDKANKEIYVARDTYGVRPLFIAFPKKHSMNSPKQCIMFASEMKMMVDLFIPETLEKHYTIKQFTPGMYSKYTTHWRGSPAKQCWSIAYNRVFSQPNGFSPDLGYTLGFEHEKTKLSLALTRAVQKRVYNTDREIACLLSGGLDSSLIAALVNKFYDGELHTWSIGLEGSEDLRCAAIVAKHLGTTHHEVVVTEQEFLDCIPEVIRDIESYDTTTVRASVGNWLISKKIAEQSEAKVVFNGDGADEVMGGYMYFHCAPNDYAFDAERRRLLSDIHYFDVLRSDRSISSHGLEARTPFLDRNFVQTYLSMTILNHASHRKCEKFFIREVFKDTGLLPDEILWRTKEAFSDGVSKKDKSWFEVIQEHVEKNDLGKVDVISEMDRMNLTHLMPETPEQVYYRREFSKHYSGCEKVIPYFWMPRFVEATDASARTLSIYAEKMKMNVIKNEKNEKEEIDEKEIIME